MSAHTPGPWLRQDNTIYTLMYAGWRNGVEQFKNRFYLAVSADFDCPDEEYEANIKLIAAAPELLAALIAFEEFGNLVHIREQISEAIAKATK